MQALSRRQLVVLVLLTLVWGFNWPVMKLGVTHYPALTFRAVSMWLGLPVLALALVALKVPFFMPRRHWPELTWLTLTNMLVWNICIILAVQALSSGRAAILGYTMPIFSALIGALVFASPLGSRGWLGLGAAGTGVLLLLWHELTHLAGRPAGVLLALGGAACWALGTQLTRRTRIEQPTLTLTFWMTVLATLVITVLAAAFESPRWPRPDATAGWALAYNAVLVMGFSNAAWTYLARGLPPVASTLGVMMIPVLGVLGGAAFLGEALYWQDGVAMVLMLAAIGAVLWPARSAAPAAPAR